MEAFEEMIGPGRTSKKVGCAVERLASATNLPIKPVAPTIRTRPLHVGLADEVVIVL